MYILEGGMDINSQTFYIKNSLSFVCVPIYYIVNKLYA